jgi:hypothetical protein
MATNLDKPTQKLVAAQKLIQNLVNFFALPSIPTHPTIQAVLDAAKTELAAIDAAPNPTPPAPLVVPNFVPAPTVTTGATTT